MKSEQNTNSEIQKLVKTAEIRLINIQKTIAENEEQSKKITEEIKGESKNETEIMLKKLENLKFPLSESLRKRIETVFFMVNIKIKKKANAIIMKTIKDFHKMEFILDGYIDRLIIKFKEIQRLGVISRKRTAKIEEIQKLMQGMKQKVAGLAQNESKIFCIATKNL